jgi:hypothetical protein
LIAAGIGVVTLAGAGLALTTDATASTGGNHFALQMRQESDTNVDLGTPGFSVGDEDLGSGPLLRSGRNIGWADVSCTNAALTETLDQICEFVLHLGSSQIVASGSVRAGENGPGPFTLAITGGTGSYRGARGEITVTPADGPSVPIDVALI